MANMNYILSSFISLYGSSLEPLFKRGPDCTGKQFHMIWLSP